MPERILIVKLGALGDVVSASALVTRIRAERPSAAITWMCGERARPLVELFGVDDIIAIDDRALLTGNAAAKLRVLTYAWRRVMSRRFEVVILAHADWRYRALTWSLRLSRARVHRLSLEPFQSPDIIRIRGRAWSDEYARLLDGNRKGPVVVRYAVADARDRIAPATPAPERPLAVLAPGGAKNLLRDDPLRRWPLERYVALAAALAAAGYDVALVGDAADSWILSEFSAVQTNDYIGKLDLAGTLALMRTAAFVVAHDSGPLHLARLVRAPLVALYGPTTPTEVAAAAQGYVALWGGDDLPCRPCYNGRDYAACSDNVCMQRITVSQVIAAAQTVQSPVSR